MVAFIAGRFTLPGFRFGHAGALVERGRGTFESKVEALGGAGVAIAQNLKDVPGLLKDALAAKGKKA